MTAGGLAADATGTSLGRLAELALERTGGDGVLIFEGERWTDAELAARGRRLSGGLRTLGVRPGDRVVVCMANCPEVSITYHAVWRAGAAVTPVLFLVGEAELRHVLADSGAVLAVTTPEFLAKVAAAARGIPAVRGIVVAGGLPGAGADGPGEPAAPPLVDFVDFAELERAAEGPLVDIDPTGMAALLYTGGTTGRAKGVVLSHDGLSVAAWSMKVTRGDDRQVGLLPLPMSHVYGLSVSVLTLQATEPGVAVLMRWFDPVEFLRLVAEHRVEGTAMVPPMVQMLLALPIEEYDTSSLVRVSTGGAPLLRQTAQEWSRRVPHVELAEGYGCTETSAIVAATPRGRVRLGSVGVAAPGVEVRIERPDGDGGVAGPGEDGEICVRGPVVMSGYWHAEEETRQAIRDGWLHTGDIGHLDADGYLYVVDRMKDLILRGGFNVYPRDVEDAMLTHPDVAACGVVGRPEPRLGEEVVAFVQLRPGATVTAGELVGYAKSRLSAVKYPREVRVVDSVPLTSVLKTDRKALRALLREAEGNNRDQPPTPF